MQPPFGRSNPDRIRATNAAILSAFALLVAAGCAREGESEIVPPEHRFPLSLGDHTVHVELAVTQEEQSQGLMFREELTEDAGMLFVSYYPRRMSFFMRNTPLPLDIGYFSAEGVLREVHRLYPYDETPVRSQSSQIQFALEMNQGWYSENGVRRGAELDLEQLTEALRRRGFSPEDFGL